MHQNIKCPGTANIPVFFFFSCVLFTFAAELKKLCKICLALFIFFPYTNILVDNIQDFVKTHPVYWPICEVLLDVYLDLWICERHPIDALLTWTVVLLEFYTSVTYLQQLMIYKRKEHF